MSMLLVVALVGAVTSALAMYGFAVPGSYPPFDGLHYQQIQQDEKPADSQQESPTSSSKPESGPEEPNKTPKVQEPPVSETGEGKVGKPENSGQPLPKQSPSSITSTPDKKAATSQKTAKTTSKRTARSTKRKHKKTRRPQPAKAGDSGTVKRVIRDGGTVEPNVQLTPGENSEPSREHEDMSQLIAGTDANLKKLSGRDLTGPQQDSVNQIHRYLDQARSAEQAGDLQRAHNLAFKAHLLSDELTRH